MGGLGGAREGAGRPKGSKGKLNEEAAKRLAEMNCDPLEGMAKIAEECMAEGDRALAGAMYKELAKYVAPQLKSVEYKIEGEVKHDHAFDIRFIAPPAVNSFDTIDGAMVDATLLNEVL